MVAPARDRRRVRCRDCYYRAGDDHVVCIPCNSKQLNVLRTELKKELERTSTEFESSLARARNGARNHIKEWEGKLKLETANFSLQTKELQSKLNFLRLQLDNEYAGELFKPDVTIIVDGNKDNVLYAHKFVLASKSPVFCKMFEIYMLERATGIVHMHDATLPTIRAVIEFCYSAEIVFNDEVKAEEVLRVAHQYSINLLVEICEEQLIQTIDIPNMRRRLKLAKTFELRRLCETALAFFTTHFDDLI